MSTITATISTTVSPIPALRHRDTVIVFPADQNDFVAKYEANNDHLVTTTVAEINAVGDQIDIVSGQMNVVAGEVNTNKLAAQLAQANAETAMTTAYATANFKGAWDDTTDFGGSSCEYLGLIYVSKVSPNVNHLPTDTNYFTPLTQALPIDETISHLSTTAATVNADGTLATMTYTGGYKTLYTYTTGNLTKVEYTDTDGITVLLTETISYTVDGIPLITRS